MHLVLGYICLMAFTEGIYLNRVIDSCYVKINYLKFLSHRETFKKQLTPLKIDKKNVGCLFRNKLF